MRRFMPSWLVKAAIQGMISQLPASHRLNNLLQRGAGSLDLTEERFAEKYSMALRHIGRLEEHGIGITGGRVLEIGTGWHPIVPVAIALHGAREVLTIDIREHLRRGGVLEAIDAFRLRRDRLGGSWSSSAADRLQEASHAATPLRMLQKLGVTRLVGRLEDVAIGERAVNAVVSNNTLEHVPTAELANLLEGSRRLVGPGGGASHAIDLRDHYANFDPSLSVHNFLRYDEPRWRPFNNALQFHNRLRAPAYRRAFEAAGWEIVHEEAEREPLGDVRPAEPFAHIPRGQLEITQLHLVVRAVR